MSTMEQITASSEKVYRCAKCAITIEQFRAARALLGWSQQELAAKSRVSRNAIIKFENSMSTPLPRTLEDVVEAFEDAGVIFIPEDDGAGVGVRLQIGRNAYTP